MTASLWATSTISPSARGTNMSSTSPTWAGEEDVVDEEERGSKRRRSEHRHLLGLGQGGVTVVEVDLAVISHEPDLRRREEEEMKEMKERRRREEEKKRRRGEEEKRRRGEEEKRRR